ncbi:MAG: hypothetical protein AAF926_04685, partial [Pseudomonadota bacterium]
MNATTDTSPFDGPMDETDYGNPKGLTRAPLIIFPIGLILGIAAIIFGARAAEEGSGPAAELFLFVLFLILGIVSIILAVRLSKPKPRRGISRRIQTILLPILILLMFPMASLAVIKANVEPEEQRRPFTPLAVMADSA